MVTVSAAEAIRLDGDGTRIFTRAIGTEDAGRITVSAPHVSLTGGAQIDSSAPVGSGRGGAVTVSATETITLDGARTGIFANVGGTFFAEDAGQITVSAPRVSLAGGARIDSSTSGGGSAGEAMVSAAEAITLDGAGTGIFSGTSDDVQPFPLPGTSRGGSGAPILVSAPVVSLAGGPRSTVAHVAQGPQEQ